MWKPTPSDIVSHHIKISQIYDDSSRIIWRYTKMTIISHTGRIIGCIKWWIGVYAIGGKANLPYRPQKEEKENPLFSILHQSLHQHTPSFNLQPAEEDMND
jgi:hypothetical protein